jgi:hypothetical protein
MTVEPRHVVAYYWQETDLFMWGASVPEYEVRLYRGSAGELLDEVIAAVADRLGLDNSVSGLYLHMVRVRHS